MQLAALLLLLLAVSRLDVATGQGLTRPPPDAARATGTTSQQLRELYKRSGSWHLKYRKSRSYACRDQKGSLCAARLDNSEKAELMLATSPEAYDSRKAGGFSAVSRVQDQSDCFACVAFAIVATAETSLATALRKDASSMDFSEQDFYFCKASTPEFEPSCFSTWSLKEGLWAWIRLANEGNYITNERCLPFQPSSPTSCRGKCSEVDPALPTGRFTAEPLAKLEYMQDYIRNHGSVLCSIEISSDFRPFFKSNPKGVYRGPGGWRCNYKLPDYWITRSSTSPKGHPLEPTEAPRRR
jgi:hypothetical protein